MDGRAATTAADTRRRTVCLLYRCLRPPLNSLLAPCCSHGRRQNAAGPAADTVDGRAATTAADARRWAACLLYCCLRPCCRHPAARTAAARLYCCLWPCCWHPAACSHGRRQNAAGPAADTVDGRAATTAADARRWTACLLYCCLQPCCWHPAARLYCCLRPCCWHPAARTAAVRMLLASLLTPWTDVLLLLRCWH